MSELREALRPYDGRAISMLSEIRANFNQSDDFLSELIDLVGVNDDFISDGATWLIKDCVISGSEPTEQDITALVQRLDSVSTWPAILHLCQLAQHIPFTSEQARQFGTWASGFVSHERPFVRAWSMDALQYAARLSIDLSAAAESSLAAAQVDGAASVRARAKKHLSPDKFSAS